MGFSRLAALTRRRTLAAPGALAIAWLAAARARAADDVERLIQALAGARSYKVRLQAAVVLARMKDPRVPGALVRAATQDASPLVRAFAVKVLGRSPGGVPAGDGVRAAVVRARQDPDARVRAAAVASLAALNRTRPAAAASPGGAAPPPTGGQRKGGPARLVVGVRAMGDHTRRAAPALKERMRAAMVSNLAREPFVTVGDPAAPDVSYVVDGAIRKLQLSTAGEDVETVCAVELVVSRNPSGIVLVAQGEAAVQRPRRMWKPEQRAAMESEALDHAVRSAHENLAQFLSTASGR